MIRKRIAVLVGALFALSLIVASSPSTAAARFEPLAAMAQEAPSVDPLAVTVPAPRPDVVVLERTSDALDEFLATLLGGATAALVFVGSAFVLLRPYLLAKAAEAIQSVRFDKRGVFEQAVQAGLELHPNRPEEVVGYLHATIPETIRDLGINTKMLPSIVEARKLALDREREDRRKRAA